MKILVVEDNENSRVLLESALEASGYEVESAENGKAALAIASHSPPDLIISDILMPEMDGYAFCRAVKAKEQLRAIPFIFYTATYTDANDEKLAMDLGASRFIVKPMEMDVFLAEIKNVLENYRAKKLPVPEQLLKSEEELQKSYAEVLVKKLDKKVRQLEEDQKQLAKTNKRLQQSQKMEAIGTLAGGIAHDFNNILTPIIGYTEMTQLNLSEGSKDWQNLQEVINAAYRARDLIKQILTFSRHTEKEKKPVLLQVIVREALKLLRSSIPTTIEIRESIEPGCDAVSANPTQMHQILINLCANAHYAMREKGGILTVSLARIDISPDNYIANLNLQTGKYLRLEVSDTGTGIEKNNLERIYEPYFTTKPKGEGTGFGLSVVHGIVTNHGGYITVYSEPGKGTTFHVYLPVIIKYQAADEPRPAEEVTGGTERILLVDDDETIGSMVKKQLGSLGYQVIMLTSGVEAAETFYKAPQDFDLVVTDMTMPKMTGAELSQELLKIRPDIPIILCSGFSELIDKDKAIDIGIQEYLIKPISRKDLAWAVRKALDKK